MVDGFTRAARFGVLSVLSLAAGMSFCGAADAQQSYCATHDLPARFKSAPWQERMHYEVRQVGQSKVFVATGAIEANSATEFAGALTSAGVVDEVWLASPGGVVNEGLAIGRLLRRSGLIVRISNGSACVSSCTLAFLGGAIRVVDPDAYYGVHMFSIFFDRSNAVIYTKELVDRAVARGKVAGNGATAEYLQKELMLREQSTAVLSAKIAKYLVEMSASLSFLDGMFGQEQLGVCYLSRQSLIQFNVVNSQ